jgi:hypothetical protein
VSPKRAGDILHFFWAGQAQNVNLPPSQLQNPRFCRNEADVIKKAKERAEKSDKASCLPWMSRVFERSDGYREINEVAKLLIRPASVQSCIRV